MEWEIKWKWGLNEIKISDRIWIRIEVRIARNIKENLRIKYLNRKFRERIDFKRIKRKRHYIRKR
jgi:hypothetical protein